MAVLDVETFAKTRLQSKSNVRRYLVVLVLMDTDVHLQIIETWFRFLVKQLRTEISLYNPAYVWYEMGFFIRYGASQQTTFLCFDVPDVFRTRLLTSLSLSSSKPGDLNKYSLHTLLLNEIVHLYEDSVWAIRDAIRDVEEVSLMKIGGTYGSNDEEM